MTLGSHLRLRPPSMLVASGLNLMLEQEGTNTHTHTQQHIKKNIYIYVCVLIQ